MIQTSDLDDKFSPQMPEKDCEISSELQMIEYPDRHRDSFIDFGTFEAQIIVSNVTTE